MPDWGETRLESVERRLRQVLAELELVSHVPAVNLDPLTRETSGEGIGGKRPPGGIDRRDDRRDDDDHHHPQKSVDHFRRRLAHARTDEQRALILTDAEAALAAWKRQPAASTEPAYGSPQWKRWVAESKLSHQQVADKFGISRSYVAKVRKQYREAA